MDSVEDKLELAKPSLFFGSFFWVSFVLCLSFLAAFLMGNAVLEINDYISRRQQNIELLHEIDSLVTDLETGQRGFVITGNEEFLDPYLVARNALPAKLADLNRRAGNEFPTPDLDRLQRLISDKTSEMRSTVELRRTQGYDAAANMVKSGRGREMMVDISRQISRFVSIEVDRIDEATQRQNLLSNIRTLVFGLATALSLFVLARAYRRIQQGVAIVKQKSAEIADQRELLEVTLRSIGDAVIVTDTEARITFINRVASDLTGWSPEEAVGKNCAEVFHIISEETRDVVESPVDRVLQSGLVVGLANHTLLIRKDGKEIPIDDSGAPIKDSEHKIRGVVLIFRDFTEHREARDGLIRARDDAEHANRAKDQFLASLSHELRTPLTPIAATLAAWESSPNVPADLRPQVQLMRRNVDLEARLIDDLLDLTRIVQGKLSLNSEVIDLHDLIEATTEMYQSDIQGKRLQVRLHLDATRHHAYADPARVQQIFWNILKNATKFTPKHGLIEIRSRNLSDTHIAIAFRDTGIGMTPETLANLFKPFEQGADEIVRRAGGLGLGMAISQALVSAQSGRIEAESDGQGKGSTFTVFLPTVDAPAPVSAAARAAAARVGVSRRVLMVEDHPDTADVMAMLLRQFGHAVRVAQTVGDALAALKEEKFDILVSDVGLPDGTGVDLIRQVREEYGDVMPAIALTGFGMEEDIARTRAAGFNEHLTKPVNSQKLESFIQKLTASKD